MTTIAKWRHEGKDVTWQGETWHWSKHVEFDPYFSLPSVSALPLEMAVSSIRDDESARLREHGWRVIPSAIAKDPPAYRDYIQGSLGEFSTAKEQYVRPRSGWFSDRTVCYLAAGRPAVVQDTGLQGIPVGRGLLTFQTVGEASDALAELAGNYEQHCLWAEELAREYFGAELVLEDVVSRIDT
jgi:hypothetical protein